MILSPLCFSGRANNSVGADGRQILRLVSVIFAAAQPSRYAAESSIIAVKKIVMDAAIAGLIGTAIGAVAGMAGTLITNYLQAKQEHAKWIRDKRVEAYSIKYNQVFGQGTK